MNCDLRHVTTVLCCDPKAFTHTNPLDGIQEGGGLVWESDAEGERAMGRILPSWARKQIIDKNIRVFTLPGFAIARKATDRGDLQLRMQGNAFLGAFFAVSTLLKEFGITQEQFREVVHKQYVKKFGKMGDAVVAVEHGSHDPGLRAREGDQDRRVECHRSFFAARCRIAAILEPVGAALSEAGACYGKSSCRSTPVPAGQGPRTPVSSITGFRRGVPLALWIRSAGHAACSHGSDCCRNRRHHRIEVCRAPRGAAVHSRELHPVHGDASRFARTQLCPTHRRI